MFQEIAEVVVQRSSTKKLLLKISQNSQENTRTRVSFLIKLLASGLRDSSTMFSDEFCKKHLFS